MKKVLGYLLDAVKHYYAFPTKENWKYIKRCTKDVYYYALEPYHDTKRGFQNLYKWRKIIWSNRGYDFYFLQVVLDKQLEEMENSFRDEGIDDIIAEEKMYRIQRYKIYKEIKWTRRLLELWLYPDYSSVHIDVPIKHQRKLWKVAEAKEEKARQLFAKHIKNLKQWW